MSPKRAKKKFSKHDPLTEEEMVAFSVSREVKRAVEQFATDNYLETGAVRVLDWGCGRGRSVARLREWGYEAFGVDIDPAPIENGRRLFRDRGLDPTDLLKPLDDIAAFPDGFFHVIFSEQVLEHVRDLERFVDEAWRLTRSGGIGIHSYPGRRNVIEEHLFMPLVHWFPKSPVRRSWIRFFVGLGREPGWKEFKGKSRGDRAQAYYDYSISKTFYRSARELRSAAVSRGFEARSRPARYRYWQPPSCLRFLDGFPIGNMLLLTRKPASP